MLNYYHIIYSFVIIGFCYLCLFIYENFAKDIFKNNKHSNKKTNYSIKKIKNLKKKFDIETTEENFKQFQKCINLPSNITINKVKEFSLSQNIIKLFDINNKNTMPLLYSYIYTKLIYNKIFLENDEDKIIDLKSFYKLYKKLTLNDIDGYNIVLKMYSSEDNNKFQYIYMNKHKLIKINNYDEYENILNNLINNNKFVLNNDNNYYISIGDYNIFDLTPENIKTIFFNKEDLKNKIYKKNYKQFKKYNKIVIIYWISTKICF